MDKKTIFVFKGCVFDKNDRILIDNRKEEILEKANSKWELPGGKIEFGETPEDAVKREIFEETGYNVIVKEIIPYTNVSVWQYPEFKQHTIVFSYLCELEDDNHVEIKDNRVNKCKWIDISEIEDHSFLPGAKEAIKNAISIRK